MLMSRLSPHRHPEHRHPEHRHPDAVNPRPRFDGTRPGPTPPRSAHQPDARLTLPAKILVPASTNLSPPLWPPRYCSQPGLRGARRTAIAVRLVRGYRWLVRNARTGLRATAVRVWVRSLRGEQPPGESDGAKTRHRCSVERTCVRFL